MQITAYFAPQFHQFRSLVLAGGEQQFLASISRCRKWNSKGGKSNVYFAKTRDDRHAACLLLVSSQGDGMAVLVAHTMCSLLRYVVKQLSKPEKQFILNFIPPYFKYLSAARQHGQESCLARIVGLFQVILPHERISLVTAMTRIL